MLGTKIKDLREKEGLSQERFAQEIGFSQAAISAWENGSREPGSFALVKLAKHFNTTLDYLLNGTTQKANARFQLEEKNAQAISPDEQHLLEVYRKLNKKNQAHVTAYAEIRLEEQPKEKKS